MPDMLEDYVESHESFSVSVGKKRGKQQAD